MDELIDVITANGEPTTQIVRKSEVHKKGLYHNTAHVWLYTKDNNILLAQRAVSKPIRPLLWDVSVAGHVDAGESIETAAVRETKEEIGLTISEKDLFKIGIFRCFQSYPNGITDNEFHHTYISELTIPVSELTPRIGEVEAVKLVSETEFLNKLEHSDTNNHFVSTNKHYYLEVLHAIKNKLKN